MSSHPGKSTKEPGVDAIPSSGVCKVLDSSESDEPVKTGKARTIIEDGLVGEAGPAINYLAPENE